MAEFEVSTVQNINFGATGNDEILQNIAMILSSVVYSCPMDRSFAWDGSILDKPINVAKSLLVSRLIAAVKKYEPRAQIISVKYQGDGIEGLLKPIVRVRITDG